MLNMKFLTGAAVGYVIGARAGRDQYDKLVAKVRQVGGGELAAGSGGRTGPSSSGR